MKHLKTYKLFESSSIDSEFKEACNDYLSDLENFEFVINSFDWYGTRQGMVRILNKNKYKFNTGGHDEQYTTRHRFKMSDIRHDVLRMMGIVNFKFAEAITRGSDMKNINRPKDENWERIEDIPDELSMDGIELYFELGKSINESYESGVSNSYNSASSLNQDGTKRFIIPLDIQEDIVDMAQDLRDNGMGVRYKWYQTWPEKQKPDWYMEPNIPHIIVFKNGRVGNAPNAALDIPYCDVEEFINRLKIYFSKTEYDIIPNYTKRGYHERHPITGPFKTISIDNSCEEMVSPQYVIEIIKRKDLD